MALRDGRGLAVTGIAAVERFPQDCPTRWSWPANSLAFLVQSQLIGANLRRRRELLSPQVAGSNPAGGIPQHPANPTKTEAISRCGRAVDFPTDFPGGPFRGRGGSQGVIRAAVFGAGGQSPSTAAKSPRKPVGRFGRLVVCTGYGSTINSKRSGLAGGGSTPAPGAGRLVSQRQDELGL